MNHAPQLYIRYQQLLEQSQVMLNNARKGMWDELIASEMDYVNAVHELTQFMSDIKLSMLMQEQLSPVLQNILDNESEIKRLLQIRMDELAKLVGQSSIQQSVLTAYGKQGGQILAPQDNQDITS
ncbi:MULTISPECIES: flagella biosynthesis regulatory protein FliT [Buttiauxella]|jgi:flagellar protein FliT|uniref:Flagellar protein FliT n=1 Tax=Buttiauxella ferragutiae ATCC 51602 TaxID=1354252 RepID=A0ABX2W7F8_9ENTR|nr:MULTISPECIES: flagella biosynthesis regulatory protein FliT [Buttiauxella]AYN26599.1 flagella biosynthesis regulatory protein FliT [Buttiauxella sp. 3AFRM03]OAT26867.1 FliT family flagellar biosynthesis protein [Buttiauxella ferragutiae ATCC 51602]UNK62999.1 flagella biosynthesis regulatory protein FliT [Buttiauxella ferragutiae]